MYVSWSPLLPYIMPSRSSVILPLPNRKKIFNYAGPILVSVETVHMASDKVWFHILETTRILLAHCSLITSTDYQILSILAFNIRNLYRLFGMDLSQCYKWRNVSLDVMYYEKPNTKGSIYLPLKTPHLIAETLTMVSFADVLLEFEHEDADLKKYIGHCIYNLVAKRKDIWRTAMSSYSVLEI